MIPICSQGTCQMPKALLVATVWLALFSGVRSFAESFPKVDADLAEYDAAIEKMNAAFASIPEDAASKDWIAKKLQHMVDIDQHMRKVLHVSPARPAIHQSRARILLFEVQRPLAETSTGRTRPTLNRYSKPIPGSRSASSAKSATTTPGCSSNMPTTIPNFKGRSWPDSKSSIRPAKPDHRTTPICSIALPFLPATRASASPSATARKATASPPANGSPSPSKTKPTSTPAAPKSACHRSPNTWPSFRTFANSRIVGRGTRKAGRGHRREALVGVMHPHAERVDYSLRGSPS